MFGKKEVRAQPIAVKEALALVNTLKAGKSTLINCRGDAHMDSLTFIQAWKKQGGTSKQLNDALKLLSVVLLAQNISLELCYVPSSLNEADSLSRVLSDKHCKLAGEPWRTVENLFGPHTMDLMALNSNIQVGHSGSLLPRFSPSPTPDSISVNVFPQVIAPHENAYVFPLFVLVGPLLRFLNAVSFSFTLIVPKLNPLPYWWLLFKLKHLIPLF